MRHCSLHTFKAWKSTKPSNISCPAPWCFVYYVEEYLDYLILSYDQAYPAKKCQFSFSWSLPFHASISWLLPEEDFFFLITVLIIIPTAPFITCLTFSSLIEFLLPFSLSCPLVYDSLWFHTKGWHFVDMEKRSFFPVVTCAWNTGYQVHIFTAVFFLPGHSGHFGGIASKTEQSWKLIYCIGLVFGSLLLGAEMVPRLGLTEFGEVIG